MEAGLQKNIDSLPVLPESIQAVERAYQDVEEALIKMREAIESDPMLSANILRAANAPVYGFKREITSLQQVISLLGKDTVRCLCLENAVDSTFKLDLSPYNMNPKNFKDASAKQLSLMVNWLMRTEAKSLSILAPSAFLVDLGRIVISKYLLDENRANILSDAIKNGTDITQAEKEACGSQVTDVTATIFNHWNFEPDLIHIIRYSDDPESLSDEEQRMAAQLKAVREAVLPNGDITEASIDAAKETIEEHELDLDGFLTAIEKVSE